MYSPIANTHTAKLLKALLLLLLLLLLGLAPGLQAAQAPNFSLPTTGKGKLELSKYRGQVVYLDFWASWCEPCRKSFPWMYQLQHKYKKAGLQVITINLDKGAEEWRRFLRDHRINFPVALDPSGKIARRYNVQAMPSSYLIDRKGRIRHIKLGFLQSHKAETESRIKKLLKESSR